MKAHVTVTSKDHGLKDLMKTLKDLKEGETYVKVGVLGQAASETVEGGFNLVDVATANEFGTRDGHIPERSFLRKPFEAKRPEYQKLLGEFVKQVYEGKMQVDRMLGLMGLKISADVKNNITQGQGIAPANAPSTVKRKGSSRPLVDTGRLVNSITHEVVIKGDE